MAVGATIFFLAVITVDEDFSVVGRLHAVVD